MNERDRGQRGRRRVAAGAAATLGVVALGALLFVLPESDNEATEPNANAQGETTTTQETASTSQAESDCDEISLDADPSDLYDCQLVGSAIMIVDGLPEVSGLYAAPTDLGEGDGTKVSGFTASQPAAAVSGRCFVDKDNYFNTEVLRWQNAGPDSVSISVGVNGGGPYAAVVKADDGQVTHDYNPGQKGSVEFFYDPDTYDANNWTGVAVFKSTAFAETYNLMDFSPWTDVQYPGQPTFDFTITLVCK